MTELNRKTKETDIKCRVDISGNGSSQINTGIGFFDHMLEALSKHSGIDIDLTCKGDLHIDAHHSVEDCGIVLGKALKEEIFPIENVERYGNATVVMDEAATTCALDLSNRPFLVYDVNITGKVGEFDVELAEEFFHALSGNAGLTVHIINDRGRNKHHILEASFKAFAVALRRALTKNEKLGIPSTKGVFMIELIVLDVDGTLTNGGITYTNSGDELKTFDVADGLAIATWTKKLGKKAAIITGRNSLIVERRAKDLKIEHLYQGAHNKDEVLENILKEENLTWDQVAAIGDDLNDYKMLKKAAISFTPANGSKYLKEFVNVKCQAYGGKGAVREMIEYIVKEDGIEEDFYKRMAIRSFVLGLFILAILSYFIPIDSFIKKDKNEEIPLLRFDESIMYTLNTENMNRIVYAKEAYKYKTKDVLHDAALTIRSIDSENRKISDTLLSDMIIKRGDEFKFLNNVKFTRNDYVTIITDELVYNSKSKIAQNTLPFKGNYFNNDLEGENLYLDLNRYYMKAQNTHFEIDTKEGN